MSPEEPVTRIIRCVNRMGYRLTSRPSQHQHFRLITAADLAALTERVRRRVLRWFRMQRLLAAAAAADMLAWVNSGFSVDAFRPDHALTAPSACLVSAS